MGCRQVEPWPGPWPVPGRAGPARVPPRKIRACIGAGAGSRPAGLAPSPQHPALDGHHGQQGRFQGQRQGLHAWIPCQHVQPGAQRPRTWPPAEDRGHHVSRGHSLGCPGTRPRGPPRQTGPTTQASRLPSRVSSPAPSGRPTAGGNGGQGGHVRVSSICYPLPVRRWPQSGASNALRVAMMASTSFISAWDAPQRPPCGSGPPPVRSVQQ